jgi:hypothetical protein
MGGIVAACLLLSAAPVGAGPITFLRTISDTNLVLDGVGGMRGSGNGTLTVAGVTGPVTQSYLWWHGPSNSATPINTPVTVNGMSVTGANIGISSDNCWGFQNSFAYRADTTSLINGNGTYALTNFTKPNADVNGAGVALFSGTGRDIAIFDGNDSNIGFTGDPAGWDFTLTGINYSGGQAFLRMMVSDGQTFSDGNLAVNGHVIASGNIFQGTSVPGPNLPNGDGNLWDIVSFDITSLLTPGANSLHITLDTSGSDCLSAIAAFVDLPHGAHVAVPEPSTLALLGIGVGLLGVRLRRKAR